MPAGQLPMQLSICRSSLLFDIVRRRRSRLIRVVFPFWHRSLSSSGCHRYSKSSTRKETRGLGVVDCESQHKSRNVCINCEPHKETRNRRGISIKRQIRTFSATTTHQHHSINSKRKTKPSAQLHALETPFDRPIIQFFIVGSTWRRNISLPR